MNIRSVFIIKGYTMLILKYKIEEYLIIKNRLNSSIHPVSSKEF